MLEKRKFYYKNCLYAKLSLQRGRSGGNLNTAATTQMLNFFHFCSNYDTILLFTVSNMSWLSAILILCIHLCCVKCCINTYKSYFVNIPWIKIFTHKSKMFLP